MVKQVVLTALYQRTLKHAGPSLIVWLEKILNASIRFEHIPQFLLTGIIRPIFKGKGKNPMLCDSYRGITLMPVILKIFEYAVLECILSVSGASPCNRYPHYVIV